MLRSKKFISLTKNTALALLDLPNCISLSERGECELLKIGKCQGKKCTFMKSEEDTRKGQIHWMLRLSSLDKDEQLKISRMYYGGKMPWNE